MKNNKLVPFIALTVAAALAGAVSAFAAPSAGKLTLEDYMEQVRAGNPSLKAAEKNAEGYSLRKDEGGLLTSPYLFGTVQNFDDKKETVQPLFQGNRTKGNQYTFGIGANTPVGLNAQYSFNLQKTEIQGASQLQLPLPNYYTSYNLLELNQSLFRNGFGSETRAQAEALESSNRAQSYAAGFSALAQLVQAENAYWRLAFARQSLNIQKDVLLRSERILDWAKRRVSMQLGDKSDLLQSEAGFKLRQLELQNAYEEERAALRAFNLLRNQPEDTAVADLEIPSTERLIGGAGPEKSGTRLDVKAAEEEERALIANAQLDKEKAKPAVDLFASLAWNGRDGLRSEAINESFHGKHATMAFGVRFTAPLSFGTMRNTWKGTELAKEAASLNLERKRLDENLEWKELERRLKDARSRLSLLQTIEKVQREKYENERQRLLRGRTTTYQALTFEQDYAEAQLLRIRTQAEVLGLTAQSKLFRGEQ